MLKETELDVRTMPYLMNVLIMLALGILNVCQKTKNYTKKRLLVKSRVLCPLILDLTLRKR